MSTTLPIYSALLRPNIRLSTLCHLTTAQAGYLTHTASLLTAPVIARVGVQLGACQRPSLLTARAARPNSV